MTESWTRMGCIALAALAGLTGMTGTASAAPDDLPDGVADAALRAPATLPTPEGWPFPDAFPGTSGAGRLVEGSLQWADFVYDDHGATGTRDSTGVVRQAPAKGSYQYTDPDAHMNGADIFRVGVGLRGGDTFWRVDWTTLANPKVPIAAFGISRDADLGGGPVPWPAGAGVSSQELVATIVVSSRGAWLIDAAGKTSTVASLGGTSLVDTKAKSFVVRLPRKELPASDRVRVWAAAGVANEAGDGFAPVGLEQNARPGQPAVYNVSFRSYRQEQPLDNAWMDKAQAEALGTGDVTKFSHVVDWRDLAKGETTPEPVPQGYTNRWYVSSAEFGHGVLGGAAASSDGLPNLLGRILPYFVYVPKSYGGRTPTRLTWIMHSLSYQHNEYGQLTPRFIQAACEDRDSICAGITGRSPEVAYFDEAELDFWETWRNLADNYVLDPDRTVISGYSMGGLATFRLGLAYPSVFAKAVSVSGGLDCGIFLIHGVGAPGAGSSCAENGTWSSIRPSARWVPWVIGADAGDWASPPTATLLHRQEFSALGYRWRTEEWPEGEHLGFLMLDRFGSIGASMNGGPRKREPGRITFTWFTNVVRDDMGLGPTSVYWLSRPIARTKEPGLTASIDATSEGRPEPKITIETLPPKTEQAPGETPRIIQEERWKLGDAPAAANRAELTLTNVASVGVLGEAAGLRGDQPLTIKVTSDGESSLRLDLPLRAGTKITSGGDCAKRVDVTAAGASFAVGSGTCTVDVEPGPEPKPAGSCLSRRGFYIRLGRAALRGRKVARVRVTLNGRPLKVLRGRRIRAFVQLKGLPRGTHVVRIEVRLRNGRLLKGVRDYRTCESRRKKGSVIEL